MEIDQVVVDLLHHTTTDLDTVLDTAIVGLDAATWQYITTNLFGRLSPRMQEFVRLTRDLDLQFGTNESAVLH
jgi:hypothetical protein